MSWVTSEAAMSAIDPPVANQEAEAPHMRAASLKLQPWLLILLSVIAGMVDVIGFLRLDLFTAHVTGDIVVIGALLVRHDRVSPAQILAVPVFMLAVAATWLFAKVLGKHGSDLLRPLLVIQFLLITCVSIFSGITRPSVDPHGIMATIAAMIAVTAMGCQFALLRLALPVAPSTAVMTGNLTNAVLGLVNLSARDRPLLLTDPGKITAALRLLAGFLLGCVLATIAVMHLGDWAWSLPAALSGVAVVLG